MGEVTRKYIAAGVSHYLENIDALSRENDDYDLSKKGLIDGGFEGEKVYRYIFFPQSVLLQPEPDNPYDPNAVKIIVDGYHVGYIKKGSAGHIRKQLEAGNIVEVTADIGGGPWKLVEENDDDGYTLEKGEYNYWVDLSITEKVEGKGPSAGTREYSSEAPKQKAIEIDTPVTDRGRRTTMYCRHCGKEIDIGSKFCPNCGKSSDENSSKKSSMNKKPFYKRWWFWVIVAVLIIDIFGSKVGRKEAKSNPTTSEATIQAYNEQHKPTDTPTEAKPEETEAVIAEDSKATMGEKNALRKAKSYLDFSAFSYKGLIDQLEYEGFTSEEAAYGADNCGADWYEQALKMANNYLDFSAFSYKGLVDQLEYDGFTSEEAAYGVDNCGADWYEQAVKQAKSYLEFSAFSRSDLIAQLEFDGFTTDQAVHGVTENGY